MRMIGTLIFTGFALFAPSAFADEAELTRMVAIQQAHIKKLEAQLKTHHDALQALINDKTIVLKNAEGKVIADYATSAGSANTATSATTAGTATRAASADSASSADLCSRLKSEGGNNSVGVTWEGSTLYFNIDTASKVKAL
ncbi:MAG TPA: hypothetical protein VE954_16395 [Oligoflexus sp.]|uniref:hypothetical protein n=1 Tax=Oligoflexus sp. TaxID=1971216 RepID=UPI002D49E273|nr:hypothetical protein [Oligoflexus sp.]HYX34679.1 hypothetical protein [Oligoflexus sp.]